LRVKVRTSSTAEGELMLPPGEKSAICRDCRKPFQLVRLTVFLVIWLTWGCGAYSENVPRQVLAVYYGWYGNPETTGHWEHWEGVDLVNERIKNAADFPVMGAYDSHDPSVVDRQAAAAHTVGITAFIADWWGQRDFTDQGMPLLLAAAGRHGLVVSAYYEQIAGSDPAARRAAAIADLDYLIERYGSNPAWLRVGGKPVLFIYDRALGMLALNEWQEVLVQVRRNNPEGVILIADSLTRDSLAVFDGSSTYNITGETQRMAPPQTAAWARLAYPRMVAAAGPGKISSVTVIPGYDDRTADRPRPRPITDRWGGETYRALWQEAVNAKPDWVLITSWNEWHEGSELEASVEYGSRILDDTAVFAREFLAGDSNIRRR
jgi:glycoprotein endo-alpha-1,2-mannosidase